MATLGDVFVGMHVDASDVKTEAGKAGDTAGKAFSNEADDHLKKGGVFAAAPQSAAVEKGGRAGGRRMGGAFLAGASKAVAPLAAVFGAAALGNFAKGTIDEASNVEESINAVRVTYGKAAADVLKLGETSAKSFGLSKSELNNFAVQFSSFAGTVAGKGGNSAKVFEDITGRATDFASVMNIEVAQAAEIFQSGLAGETEPLKKFGINLSAAAVESHAVKEGIAAAGEEMTEAQKTQARYSLLMAETAKVQGDFGNTSDQLANQQRILAARFTNVRAELGSKLLPLATKFFSFLNATAIPAAEAIVGWIGGEKGVAGSFGKLGGTIGEVVSILRPALETLMGGFQSLGSAILPILRQIGQRIATTFMENMPAIRAIITEVAAIAGKMFKLIGLYYQQIAAVIRKVWSAIGPYVLDFLGFIVKNIITVLGGAVKIISGILTVLVGVFTGDFEMIKKGVLQILRGMWKIIAGLFRNQFALIQKWLGGWITRMTEGFMNFWSQIKSGFIKRWQTLTTILSWPFKVAARAISGALSWLWTKVILPTVGFITKIFRRMGRDIRAVWRNFLRPVVQLLGAIIRWLWQKITRPIFRAIGKAWHALGRGFQVVWRSFLRPIINAFADIARWLWRRVIRPVVKAIEVAWRGMGRLIRNVYRNTIGKVFGWFGDRARDTRDIASNAFSAVGDKFGDLGRGLRNTLNNSIKAVFRGFVRAGKWMSDSFQTVVKWIGKRWNQLKSLAAKPIRFVLDTVLNKGLIGGFNKLADFFDTDKLKPVPVPFKAGGVLPGYTPGRDVHRFTSPSGGALDLSGGEAIMRPEFTRAMGGPRGIAALNQAARGFARGGVLGELSGGSGSFTDRARQTLLAAQRLAGTQFNIFQRGHRPTTSYSGTSHAGDAVDLGPITQEVIRALRAMGWAAWDRTGMGNWVPHIHAVPLPGAGTAGGSGVWQAQDFLSGGNGLGGRDRGPRAIIGDLLGAGKNAIGGFLGGLNPTSLIQSALSKAMQGYSKFAESPFGAMAGAMPKKIASMGIDWFTDKMSSLFGGGGGVSASWSGAGVGDWSRKQLDNAATIVATARQTGVGKRGALIGLMTAMQESTLRNLSWGDRDSVGLFQQRGAWGSFGARTSPAQAASMFYNGGQGGQSGLKDFPWRGMGLGEAAQAVQVSAYPGAYSKWRDESAALLGRLWGHKARGFDSGGVWKSGTVGVNQSGKDEVVFTNAQWSILKSLISQSHGPSESWPQPGDTVVFEIEGEPMTATATRVVRGELKHAAGSI